MIFFGNLWKVNEIFESNYPSIFVNILACALYNLIKGRDRFRNVVGGV